MSSNIEQAAEFASTLIKKVFAEGDEIVSVIIRKDGLAGVTIQDDSPWSYSVTVDAEKYLDDPEEAAQTALDRINDQKQQAEAGEGVYADQPIEVNEKESE